MTLGFKQQINGKPTFFPEKILVGLYDAGLLSISKAAELARHPMSQFPETWKYIDTLRKAWGDFKPKPHTIRVDEKDLWHADRDIHFVIGNRTPRRFQFAPLVPCVSTQRIKIDYIDTSPQAIIDGSILSFEQAEQLAFNDGFDNADAFFDYFFSYGINCDGCWCGKIIHWTDLKY